MRKQNTFHSIRLLAVALILSALAAAPALGQTYNLCASDGSITMPDGAVIPVWGYVNTPAGGCATGLVTRLPGPVLLATAGGTLTINLSNALATPVSVFIPGLSKSLADPLAPETTTDPLGRERLTSLDKTVAAGGNASYSWVAEEGTYLYESGTDIRTQVPMGLYGALVVFGSGYPPVAPALQRLLVFSEIDPALNANPGGFGGARVSTWNPRYFLINGAAYPDIGTVVPPSANPATPFPAGQDVLLRMVNAGLDSVMPTLGGGIYLDLIAEDGNLYPHQTRQYGVELQAAKTIDAIINVPAIGRYPLYDRGLNLTTGANLQGGMLTYLNVRAGSGNQAPVAVNNLANVLQNSYNNVINLTQNDSGDAIPSTVVITSGSTAGGIVINNHDGTVTYTPPPGFSGMDTFTYTVQDDQLADSNVAMVTIIVGG